MIENNNQTLEVEANVELLKEIVKPPLELAPRGEAKFRWSSDGLSLRTVDGASVMMVEQEIPSVAFDSYNVDVNDGEILTGLSCRRLNELLNAAGESSTVSLTLESELCMLNIDFNDVHYSQSLIDIDSINEPPSNSELDHSVELQAHSRIFQKANQILSMAGSVLQVEIAGSDVVLQSSGDTDKATIDLQIGVDSNIDESEDISNMDVILPSHEIELSSKYSFDYIEHIPEFTPDSHFSLKFDDGYPMKIETTRFDYIDTEIIVAPRVSTTD